MLVSAPTSVSNPQTRDLLHRDIHPDHQFVHLLANMLLQAQSEAVHVY